MSAGLSALGNCIATNDYVALAHTDIDKVQEFGWAHVCVLRLTRVRICASQETEELIADVLGVSLAPEPLGVSWQATRCMLVAG